MSGLDLKHVLVDILAAKEINIPVERYVFQGYIVF